MGVVGNSIRFILVFSISLPFVASEVVAQGSAEKSSPEVTYEPSLPSLDLFASDLTRTDLSTTFTPGVDFDALQKESEVDGLVGGTTSELTSPLLTAGVFPYQPDPISAIVAAGMTLAFKSLKETGRVDWATLQSLLNSTDLYAGLVGSTVAGLTQQKVAKELVSMGGKVMPAFMKPLATKPIVKISANILNGMTYTFAVSSGYEYFSQYWKIATKNINEDVDTITGFMKAPESVKRRVIQNLMTMFLVSDFHKRIKDSVWNHRIMTYEFIATNVGLYVGMTLGHYLGAKYGPKWSAINGRPVMQKFVTYLSSVFGGITGGIAVQLTPDSWRVGVNTQLLEHKIETQMAKLEDNLQDLEQGIRERRYPPFDANGPGSYFMKGGNLESDLDRIFRVRDLLVSLETQRFFVAGQEEVALTSMAESVDSVRDRLEDVLNIVESDVFVRPAIRVDLQKASEVQWRAKRLRSYQRHYRLVVEAGLERSSDVEEEVHGLIQLMRQGLEDARD